MIKLYYYLMLLWLVGSWSCGNKSDSDSHITEFSYDSFRENKDLKEGELLIGELLDPHRIRLIDSTLFIVNLNEDRLISVYNVSNGTLLGRLLSKGRGRNELLNVWNIGFCATSNLVYFNDPNLKRITSYTINDIKDIQQKEIVLPCANIALEEPVDDVTILSSKNMIATTINPFAKERFVLIDSVGKKQGVMVEYPGFANPKETDGLSSIFQFEYVVSSDETKLAVFNRFTDLIEIYDITGNLLCMTQGPDNFASIYERTNVQTPSVRRIDGKTKRSYLHPIERGGLLWVLYSGQVVGNQRVYDKICTFDWSGTPVAIYHMPTNVYSFDVDIEKKIIYGLADHKECYTLATYKY